MSKSRSKNLKLLPERLLLRIPLANIIPDRGLACPNIAYSRPSPLRTARGLATGSAHNPRHNPRRCLLRLSFWASGGKEVRAMKTMTRIAKLRTRGELSHAVTGSSKQYRGMTGCVQAFITSPSLPGMPGTVGLGCGQSLSTNART